MLNGFAGLGFVLGPDVQPEFLNFGDLLAFLFGQEMNRFAGDDAQDRAGFRPDLEPLPDQHLHVPSADGTHAEKAHLVDMLHKKPNLVAMPGQHDSRLAGGVDGGGDVAVPIGVNLVGERSCEIADHLLNAGFVAGRSGRIEEIFQKFQGSVVHRDLQKGARANRGKT